MTIETKFNIGDEVYFFDAKSVKVKKGIIETISIYIINKDIGYNYSIKPLDTKFNIACLNVPASLIFKERDHVLDFCITITDKI